MEERRDLVVQGNEWKKLEEGIINPFKDLKKDDMIEELEQRGIDTYHMKRDELREVLNETLHGIARPPALIAKNPKSTDLNMLGNYEILCCEPLHDICNVVKNVIEELPHHINNKTTRAEFETFASKTIGQKNQISGSDARSFAIKLAKFISNQNEHAKIDLEYVQLVFALVEITSIAYSPYKARTPKQILRLHNRCFVFAILCQKLIPTPKKMTKKTFYGMHFHSLTTHLPQTARVFNPRSILVENEERSFGKLRRISTETTNRRSSVVDTAVLRFKFEQKSKEKIDNFQKQDSLISRQARLLPQQPDTCFSEEFMKQHASLYQAHLARLADFLLP